MKLYYLPIQIGFDQSIVQKEEPCTCGCTEYKEIDFSEEDLKEFIEKLEREKNERV